MDHHDDYHYAENYPLRALEDDCRLLGDLLDDCLKKEIGEELFEKVHYLHFNPFLLSMSKLTLLTVCAISHSACRPASLATKRSFWSAFDSSSVHVADGSNQDALTLRGTTFSS